MFWIVLGVILIGFIIAILVSAITKLYNLQMTDNYTELHSGDDNE